MTNKNTSIGILGAGISGLSTAYALQKKGYNPTVYEKSSQVGGMLKTIHQNGWLVEEGPNTLMVKSQDVWELLRELNLEAYITEANKQAKRRFVVKNNKLLALPMSIFDFLKTPLLSIGAKVRLLREPFINAADAKDETIASFIERRLGPQPLAYGINPFVSGVYAGDPQKLSIKHTFTALWKMEQQQGSLLKGMITNKNKNASVKKALISFSDGLQTLPKRLAQSLKNPVQTSTGIQSVKRKNNCWIVKAFNNEGSFEVEHEVIISTIPTHTLPSIFEASHFKKVAELSYAPLSMVALGFKNDHIAHSLDGFGMLIPEAEQFNTLGVLFSSTLFPNRAPKGHSLLTCFIGGARQPFQAQKPANKLIKQLLSELDQLLGITGEPVFKHHHFWPQAIPQYQVGYDRYLSIMNNIETQFPQLFLCGNYRQGVSVPDCISSGLATAEKVETLLNK